MKRLLKIFIMVALYLFPLSIAHSQSIPIESDAIISSTSTMSRANLLSLVDPAVALIKAHGWRCDSVSAIQPFIASRGFYLRCNSFSYVYAVEDKGGNWTVKLE